MKIVKFREWEFEVDEELTKKTYAKPDYGDTCTCSDCRNFRLKGSDAFPTEILQLFKDLEIDFRKHSEICCFEKIKEGLFFYDGWYHFAGKIIKGRNCKLEIDRTGSYNNYFKITDNFEIGFSTESSLSHFSEGINLVQVEFKTYIDWILDEL